MNLKNGEIRRERRVSIQKFTSAAKLSKVADGWGCNKILYIFFFLLNLHSSWNGASALYGLDGIGFSDAAWN